MTKNITNQSVPDQMAEIGDNYLERFRSSAQTAFTQQSGAMETCLQRDELMSVWAASDFVANSCIGNPGMLYELISSGDLDRIYAVGELEARVCQSIDNVEEAVALHAALRRLRKREMIRVAWRDLSGLAGLEETMANVSELARACIDQALGHHHRFGDLNGARLLLEVPRRVHVLQRIRLGSVSRFGHKPSCVLELDLSVGVELLALERVEAILLDH